MSEEESSAATKEESEAPRRLSIGSLAIVQLVLICLLFLALNYLAGTNHRTWDLTQSEEFTLSNQTRVLLKSEILQKRAEPVKIIAAMRKGSTHSVRLRAMLEEYERLADGMLEVRFVDPDLETDSALEIEDNYAALVEEVIIIDAVPPIPDPPKEAPADRAKRVEALRQAHIQYLSVESMLVFRTEGTERILAHYQDEDQLTAGIRRALEGKPRRFYLLADKSQIASSEDDAPWEFLSHTFATMNITLVPVRVSELQQIPADAAGVALIAPRYDLDEREKDLLSAYWNGPNASLLIVLDPTLPNQPANLRAFLRHNGITPRANRLSTGTGNDLTFDVLATFTTAPAVGDLGNASTMFEGASATLEVREDAEDLERRRIEPFPLIQAHDKYDATLLNGSGMTNPPHYLAASVSRGNERSDTIGDQTSRMIILSNSSFLKPRHRHAEHIDFLRNTTNWLVGREELAGIGPLPVRRYKLGLTKAQMTFANRLNVFILPGIFFLGAVFIWNARRA